MSIASLRQTLLVSSWGDEAYADRVSMAIYAKRQEEKFMRG
jgi:hypothetical protein